MAEDIDKVIKWARLQGWRVELSADGYRHFWTPKGKWVVKYPATPSRPRRRYLDVVTAVRANGLDWPPPSKKEQRSKRRRDDS